jgi:WXXGXW repeat (2 copies)
MRLTYARIAMAAVLMGVALCACVVAPAPGYGEIVYDAPPPVRYEVVPAVPAPGFFWIGGGWYWEGGRYAWHEGHWERSRPGYRWVAHSWHREGRGWRAAPGHWEHYR